MCLDKATTNFYQVKNHNLDKTVTSAGKFNFCSGFPCPRASSYWILCHLTTWRGQEFNAKVLGASHNTIAATEANPSGASFLVTPSVSDTADADH